MGEGKRNKKNEHKIFSTIIRLVPILCVICVLAFFYMILDMNKRIENNKFDTSNIVIEDTNTTTVNNTVNNTVQNTTNTVDNTVVNNVVEPENTTVPEVNISGQVIPPVEDVDIVAARAVFNEFWGEDSDSNIEIYKNDNNEYIARVTLKATGNNQYFLIDVDSRSVTEY